MSAFTNELHATLDQRARPENVAAIILRHSRAHWTDAQRSLLRQGSRTPPWSSMSDDFERVPGAEKQLETVYRIFGVPISKQNARPDDPASLTNLVDELGASLGWEHTSDYLTDRKTSMDRELGRRAYNRRIRALRHLTEKSARMNERMHQRGLILMGRSGFAHEITRERFAASPRTAMFVAYIIARKNLRRQFTLSGRDNPMDKIADMLFDRLDGSTDWEVVAWVWPKPDVLTHLSDEQLGALAARWMTVMRECAKTLEFLWADLRIGVDLAWMTVQRGMDSSTWNETAQAYNFARASWLGSVHAMAGGQKLLDPMLPGKVMRLMAADLVYWHRQTGGEPDPNTRVWARLPLPWEVLLYGKPCTAIQTRDACLQEDLDPDVSGWTTPLPKGNAADVKPTPELVHGVAISDPTWAQVLRQAGVFSGHGGRKTAPDAGIIRSEADQADVMDQELPSLPSLYI